MNQLRVSALFFVFMAVLLLTPACRAQSEPAPAQSRLGINLNYALDWNTELPFVDLFRFSRKWISQREGAGWGQGPALARDAKGWVTRLEPGCWADAAFCTFTRGHVPQGDYVVLYEGRGRIEIAGQARVVSQAPGRLIFQPVAGNDGFFVRLRETDPADYVRNIRVLMPGCESTYTTQPFRAGFLERWGALNTIRFKDWMLTDNIALSTWGERPTQDYCNYTERGVPVEVMADLCNRLKVNPWFCMPHTATDDYVRGFAQEAKAAVDPSLTIHVEYSNEIWNPMFTSNRYAVEQAKALKIGPPERPWEGAGMFYTRRSLEIFRIWEEAFGGPKRLMRVLAWQATAPWWSERIILPTDDAHKHVDALAIAPYINPRFGAPSTPTGDVAAAWSVDQLLDYIEQNALPNAIKAMADQKRVAEKFGLRLVAYEAGTDVVGIGPAQNNEQLTALIHSANRHPRMEGIFTRYLDAWKATNGDLMCILSSTGRWTRFGSCNLSEYYDETEADQPKLRAVMEWNRRNLR